MPVVKKSPAKPWQKRGDESDAAYARFLLYRNLGPLRSIRAAYLHETGKAPKSTKQQSAPGQWKKDSAQFDWNARAAAWDVEILTEVGKGIVVKYVNALDLAFVKIIQALDGKIAPRTWNEAIESLTILGGFIPQETVATIRSDSADDSVPAIGFGGQPTGLKPTAD